jgi:hypothetical protein
MAALQQTAVTKEIGGVEDGKHQKREPASSSRFPFSSADPQASSQSRPSRSRPSRLETLTFGFAGSRAVQDCSGVEGDGSGRQGGECAKSPVGRVVDGGQPLRPGATGQRRQVERAVGVDGIVQQIGGVRRLRKPGDQVASAAIGGVLEDPGVVNLVERREPSEQWVLCTAAICSPLLPSPRLT